MNKKEAFRYCAYLLRANTDMLRAKLSEHDSDKLHLVMAETIVHMNDIAEQLSDLRVEMEEEE